jgi:hypothetical protein
MASMYAMEVDAERRREVISKARLSDPGPSVDSHQGNLLDGLRTKSATGIRLAATAGIAIAVLIQIV